MNAVELAVRCVTRNRHNRCNYIAIAVNYVNQSVFTGLCPPFAVSYSYESHPDRWLFFRFFNGNPASPVSPEAVEADLYQRHAAGEPMPPRLPRDLHEACAALRADALLRDDVGARFCDQFLTLKQAEWDAYAQQVSDWELERYADGF